MTETTATGDVGYVAYEYTTVRADRDLESLYTDAYRNFGWTVDGREAVLPHAPTVTLRLKRDRRIKDRTKVRELQDECEQALASIARLERSKTSAATGWALGIGLVGCVFLAGAIFAIDAERWILGIPLGVVGLVGWAAGYLAFGRIRSRTVEAVVPLIDHQYDVVFATGERASHLLA